VKVVTIFGTRPEIIRLSCVLPLLDAHSEHVMVHTGQNYDERLSAMFFRDLRLRQPDVQMSVPSTPFGEQLAAIIAGTDALLREQRPDAVLILGDTNSALSAISAARLGIRLFHMEAGNRCYDDRVPEEVNRRIIDHCSSYLLPYTSRSKDNLLREGIERERIFVTGNPIFEVLSVFAPEIAASTVLQRLALEPRQYFLATIHRAENVDDPRRLASLFAALSSIAEEERKPIIVSLHPRTADRMEKGSIESRGDVRLSPPFTFFDFVQLEKNAALVLTDSGTVQEECAIFGVPSVTVREVTERAETIECGSNMLGGISLQSIRRAVKLALTRHGGWTLPDRYDAPCVSLTVAKIVLGHNDRRSHGRGEA
jgi:UDP-N-acetylglucosamine 2-epimerase (non-hydrolysing)